MDFRRSCFSFGDALVGEFFSKKGWNFGFGVFSVSGKRLKVNLKKNGEKLVRVGRLAKVRFLAMIFEELLDGLVGCLPSSEC